MPADPILILLGGATLAGAVAALTLRNLVHCALCLILVFAGLAGLYLHLGALFAGLVQVLVYVGAVGILLVFAILLTRGGGEEPRPIVTKGWALGVACAAAVAALLLSATLRSPRTSSLPPHEGEVSTRDIGKSMLRDYIIPVEAIALLLTAAAIGAIVIAMPAPADPNGPGSPRTTNPRDE